MEDNQTNESNDNQPQDSQNSSDVIEIKVADQFKVGESFGP